MATRKSVPALTALSSDWTWEQDSSLRFTRFDLAAGTPAEREHARRVLGKRCWESGVEVEGGWPAYKRRVKARERYRDVLMWRDLEDGTRRYVSVSGEPFFDPKGRFGGYRGVGRDVTAQKRGEQLLRLQHEVSRELADAAALEGCLATLRTVCRRERWGCGELWRLDEARRVMRRFACWVAPRNSVARRHAASSAGLAFAPGEGGVGTVWKSGEPLWLHGHLLCPVPSGGRVIAVLAFACGRIRHPEPALQQALLGIGTQLGLFLRRAEAEARLRESEARFRQIVDCANEGILVYDHDLNIQAANAAAARIIGVPRERLIGKPGFTSLFECVRDDGSPFRQQDRPTRITLRTRRSVTGTVIGIRRADHSVTWLLVNTALLQRSSGAPHDGIVSTISDITVRRGIELALRDSEARFRSLTDLSSDWYWEQDDQYRFIRLEGRHVAGGDEALRRQLIGKRRWESGLEIDGGWDEHRKLLEAHRPFHSLLMWRTMPDGKRRYVAVSGEPVFDRDGRFTGYRGVGRDLTQQKRAEHLLRLEHRVASALSQARETMRGVQAVLRLMVEAENWEWGEYLPAEPTAEAPACRAAWGRPGQSGRRKPARLRIDVTAEGESIGVLAFGGGRSPKPDEGLLEAAQVIGSQVGQFLRRMQAEESLRESEARFRALTEMSSDFFWETDAQHSLRSLGRGSGRGGEVEPLLDPAAWEPLRETMQARRALREVKVARPQTDGTMRYYALSGDPQIAADGRFLGYCGVGRDITSVTLAHERIATLAYRDALTGLDNRASLLPTLEKAIERTRRRGARLAGLFVDLDGFKLINDAFGHDAGDRLLAEIARRLRSGLRSTDLVARLGGDEFFVVLEDLYDATPAERVAQKLLAAIREPYAIQPGEQAVIAASVGISLFPDDAGDAATLMKHADMAMYEAKQAGKNAYRLFSPAPAANEPQTRAERRR